MTHLPMFFYEFWIQLEKDDTFHKKKLSDDMAHIVD